MSNINLQRLLVRNTIGRVHINNELGVKISNDSIVFKSRSIIFLKCILILVDVINVYKIFNVFVKPIVFFKHSPLQFLDDYKTDDVFLFSRVNHDRTSHVLKEFIDQNTINYFIIHLAIKCIARLSHVVSNRTMENILRRENVFNINLYNNARYQIATTYLKYYLFLCITFLLKNKKIVIREEAHYQHSFLLNRWFKEKNIHVCEPQHGLIYKGHDAYNFSVAEFQSGIANYLPDVIFIFGNYWADKFNSPAVRVVLGQESAHRNKYRAESDSNGKQVLIISDGLNFEFFLNLALNIRSVVGNEYSVMLRPHPLERQNLLESSIVIADRDSIIIDRGELAESLSSCEYVISEMSTVLYESLSFGCTILMIKSDVSDFVFGLVESDVLHVVDHVMLVDFRSIIDSDPLEVYTPGFTRSYKNYLKDNIYVRNS